MKKEAKTKENQDMEEVSQQNFERNDIGICKYTRKKWVVCRFHYRITICISNAIGRF